MNNSLRVTKNSDSHVYLDVDILNFDDKDGLNIENLNYICQRDVPYLDDPSKYLFSIVRFSLTTADLLPIWVPVIQPNQINPDLTVYQISLINGASIATRNLIYLPSDFTIQVSPPLEKQDLTNDYYFVYTMQKFVTMINTCFVLLAADVSATETPFLYYDTETARFTFYIPESYTVGPGIQIYFNTHLKTLLATTPFNYAYTGTQTIGYNGNAYELQVYNNNDLNIETVSTIPYILVKQEVTSLPCFNPVSSILFSSSNIPVSNTLTGPPYSKESNKKVNLNLPSGNANFTQEVTSMLVNVNENNRYACNVVYEPTAEYRLLSMVGNNPIYNINLSCRWRDIYGNIRPLKLPVNCSASLKMMFRLKTYNNL